MLNGTMKLLISDIRSISRVPILFCALFSPVFITLFLLYIFPLISGFTSSDDIFLYKRYYTVTAITLISAIPFIYGLLFSFIHQGEYHSPGNNDEFANKDVKWHIYMRMGFSVFLSFSIVLPVIYLTDAVSTEGWLRSIYTAFLLAIMASFIFLFIVGFAGMIKNLKVLSLISLIFLITVPSGLLLHHPWNYFAFFSPFYWLSWAWVIASPAESLLYGIISLSVTATCMRIFYRSFLRNSGIP
jgi:hypothetical protein